jgi:dihydroorotase
MRGYLFRGGRIIDPSQKMDETADLLIEEGRIAEIGKDLREPRSRKRGDKAEGPVVLDIQGKIISPGLIDMHTHLREPGFEYKETIETGSRAAAAGGFTALACMPNTNPVNDNRSVTEYVLRKARDCGLVRVYPIAAVSRGSEGKVLAEMGDLKDAGAVAFSDDGRPVMNSTLMRRALEYANSFGRPVISHCEDYTLSQGGLMNESFVSTELGLRGIPNAAEDIMVMRDIALAEYTGTSVHIAHVSTAGAVRIIRDARARGVKVTAETAPHYFTLTDEALRAYDTNTKVNPPLRTRTDVEALKEGLRDGTIDAIASDHAPHASTDKDVEFEYAASGIVGLETSLGLSLRLVEEGICSMSELILKMSTNPAGILRVSGGTLKIGNDADITIIDPEMIWKVDSAAFKSKSRNSPFNGWRLKGKAVCVIVGGEIKMSEFKTI